MSDRSPDGDLGIEVTRAGKARFRWGRAAHAAAATSNGAGDRADLVEEKVVNG